ncbi:MAG: ankyrin repeat domain-containing protein [Limisphaerales bacterium]
MTAASISTTKTQTASASAWIRSGFKLVPVLGLALFLAGCGSSPESARQGLAKLGKDFTPASFIECVANGDKEAVRLFMAAGIDVNGTAGDGLTALMVAAMKGNTELVKTLLDRGANPNAAMASGTLKGNTALMLAATQGRVEAASLLLGKGADFKAKDDKGLTAVDYAMDRAASQGDPSVLKLLRDHGAPLLTDAALAKMLDKFRRDVRMKAITSMDKGESPDGCRKIISEQLAAFKDQDHFTSDQMLQAQVKAFNAVWDAIGASVQGTVTSMEDQAQQKAKPFKEFLKELQADPAVQRELLLAAAGDGKTGVVGWLLAQGANVNVKSEAGFTPLIFTITSEHAATARVLLDAGADVNMKGYKGLTPIILASYKGNAELVKLLLERKADVNAVNDEGQSAIQAAKAANHADVVVLLKEAGAKE